VTTDDAPGPDDADDLDADDLDEDRHDEDELDEDAGEGDDRGIRPTSSVGRFRRTGAGMVLNSVAMGLAEVFDPTVYEDPPIVQEAPGEPDVPRQVDAYLDPDDPAASAVIVRSWRFGGDDADASDGVDDA
jgi:hypothetical protein